MSQSQESTEPGQVVPTLFPMPDKNTLFYGDNLDVLPRVASESVDLIYLDPPFKSDKHYNAIFRTAQGVLAPSQIHAFDDTWKWTLDVATAYQEFTANPASPPEVVAFLRAMQSILADRSDMMAYLAMMAPRLIEMRRVLKPTGSIYLHCDPTASHYLKLLMDNVFGVKHFVNEIVWSYRSGGASPKRFSRKHDVLFCYSKSDDRYFQPAREVSYNRDFKPYRFQGVEEFCDEGGRWYTKPYMRDVWDIDMVGRTSAERLGYPTQKPIALLRRIIETSCPEGGVVLDPFCGCGTAVDAAQELGRRWIGIDITILAIFAIIQQRLIPRYGNDVTQSFDLDGIPREIEAAEALSAKNKLDFERWAVMRVGGRPTKASGDYGVDGEILFARTYKDPPEIGKCIVSVKAGGVVPPSDMRDLLGAVIAEGAQMGVLITRISPPQGAGIDDVIAKAGTYIHEATGAIYPRLQVLTIREMFDGKEPRIPSRIAPHQQATWAPGSEAVQMF